MWHVWETRQMRRGFWWERPEEKRPLAKPRPRWEDNIKMDLQEVEWGHGPDLSGSEQ